jgi:hypothetical protein
MAVVGLLAPTVSSVDEIQHSEITMRTSSGMTLVLSVLVVGGHMSMRVVRAIFKYTGRTQPPDGLDIMILLP